MTLQSQNVSNANSSNKDVKVYTSKKGRKKFLKLEPLEEPREKKPCFERPFSLDKRTIKDVDDFMESYCRDFKAKVLSGLY